VFTQAAFPTALYLIDALRQVKFQAATTGDSAIQRGRTSVGKEASAAATFLQDVPETVTVSVPIFENYFARGRRDVLCALEVHEAEQRFQIFPLPGQLELAITAAEFGVMASLAELLPRSERAAGTEGAEGEAMPEIPIFHGSV